MSTIDYILAQDGDAVKMIHSLDLNNQYIKNLNTPVNPTDAASKQYVDTLSPIVSSVSSISSADLNNVDSITVLSGKYVKIAGLTTLDLALKVSVAATNTMTSFSLQLPDKITAINNVYDVYGHVSGYFDLVNQYTIWNTKVSGIVGTSSALVSFKSHTDPLASETNDPFHYIFIKVEY